MRQAAAPTAQAASPRGTAAIRALRGFGAAALAAVGSAPALAHALAPRYDLPLPLWHYLGGAAASVALSFLVVALARRPLRPMAVTLETSAGAALARGVGVRFKGVEKTNVDEYCVSEGWVRVSVGNSKTRTGQAMTLKLAGPVEPYFKI